MGARSRCSRGLELGEVAGGARRARRVVGRCRRERSGGVDAVQGPLVDGDARVAVAGRYRVLEDGEMVE